MRVEAISPGRLVDEVADLVAARPGRVRAALDGPPPTGPVALARRTAEVLRTRGRATVVVDAGDFLRPASVRLEYGRDDPDEFLDGWLDTAALRREVLDPAAPDGSGRVLPRLWDAAADRAFRDRYTDLPADGVVLLAGGLLLGRGLPLELTVHLRMGAAALARTLPEEVRWTLPAYDRYGEPAADLTVLADHPGRPAVVRGGAGGRGGS
ncbi:MAG: uridine kinase [Pseudonocardiales bacterium]|nr:uridine kinase [Pseudonocardiales bacterium]